jgi:hypothetical protein
LQVTCNDIGAPGLGPFVHAIKFACQTGNFVGPQYSDGRKPTSKDIPWYADIGVDYEKFRKAYDFNIVLISRIWQRTLKYLADFIEKSPSNLMGRVYGHFSRIEFQSAGSPGKLFSFYTI